METLIHCYKDINNKIISTWHDTDVAVLTKFKNNGFKVILCEAPHIQFACKDNLAIGQANQTVHALYGCNLAAELGFKYVCRMRTDVFPNNHKLFLHSIRKLYTDKMTVICGYDLKCFGTPFYLDIMVCGSVNSMEKFYNSAQLKTDSRITEKFWLESYAKNTDLSKDKIKEIFHFCIDICVENGIEFIWYRPTEKVAFQYPRSIPYTKVIAELGKAYFVYK